MAEKNEGRGQRPWKNKITFSDVFNYFMVNPNREMTVEDFKAWLRQFEMDNDGRVSHEELKEAIQSLRVWFPWWKARQVMKVADTNHNGQIEGVEEIEKLVNYAQQHLHMKIHRSHGRW